MLTSDYLRNVVIPEGFYYVRCVDVEAHEVAGSDLPEVIGLCHRVLVMRDGEVAAELPGGSDAETILRHSLGSGESKKGKGKIKKMD